MKDAGEPVCLTGEHYLRGLKPMSIGIVAARLKPGPFKARESAIQILRRGHNGDASPRVESKQVGIAG